MEPKRKTKAILEHENCYALPFHAEALYECCKHDGITVMSRGLGIDRVIAGFIKICEEFPNCLLRNTLPAPEFKPVFLVLHTSEELEQRLKMQLDLLGAPIPSNLRGLTSEQRSEKYSKGGTFFVTPRVIVVDFLLNNLNCNSVAGLLVNEGEKYVYIYIFSIIFERSYSFDILSLVYHKRSTQ